MTDIIPRDLLVAIARRESDQAELVIWRDGDVLRTRPRVREKLDSPPTWPDDEYWIHVRSAGRYSRRALVDDQGTPSWYYVSDHSHVGWVRPVSEWEEQVDGVPRFTRDQRALLSIAHIRSYMDAGRYKVSVSAGQLANFLKEAETSGGVDLDPDFQRGHVWTAENQTRFIEHLLRGGAHGRTIVWNDPSYGDPAADRDLPDGMVIVDGKQRLTSLLAFLHDGVTVFDGHVFSQFDRASRMSVLSATGTLRIEMNVLGLQHRRELLGLYLELNEGAVAHDPSELMRVRALLEEQAR